MDSHADKRVVLRQYLLGELSDDSRQRVEETLLTDDDFYQELLIAEDELVDEYLAGALPAGARERFESHFLVTQARRQKLSFASSFRKYVAAETAETAEAPDAATAQSVKTAEAETSRPFAGVSRPSAGASRPSAGVSGPSGADAPQPATSAPPAALPSIVSIPFYARRPALTWALAATLLLAVSATYWLATRDGRAPAAGVAANVFQVELTTGAVRQGGEMTRVAPPADAGVVRLSLQLPAADHRSYQAALKADDGRVLLTRDDLQSRAADSGPAVAFDVPAELLARGDYRVALRGLTAPGAFEDVADYSFRVAR